MPSFSRDIICIGASAGGVEALQAVVRNLPRHLNATLFVVLHIPAYAKSYLPDILGNSGALKARTPISGEKFLPGTIYIAPPDHHMLLEGDAVMLVRGPKENRCRPAVDPLFRSAAEHHPLRSIGVVLSGMLDDGKAGLWFLKKAGGIAVVQKFSDCLYPDMPRNAAAETEIDHVSTAADMGDLLHRLCSPTPPPREPVDTRTAVTAIENAYAAMAPVPREEMGKIGVPSSLICPECNGPLWQMREGPRRFRCYTGHAYSPRTLIEGHRELTERSLAVLLRLLEDEVNLLQHVRENSTSSATAAELDKAEVESRRRAALIRSLLPGGPLIVLPAEVGNFSDDRSSIGAEDGSAKPR